jgi:hypothetical protein
MMWAYTSGLADFPAMVLFCLAAGWAAVSLIAIAAARVAGAARSRRLLIFRVAVAVNFALFFRVRLPVRAHAFHGGRR